MRDLSSDFGISERFLRNFLPIPLLTHLQLGPNASGDFELPIATNNRSVASYLP
jgi:hypothetical protein